MTLLPAQVGFVLGSQPGGGVLAFGAPTVLNSTPAEAVVSFDAMVLLMMLTFSASWRETPPPSQPATLSAMMLFVTVTLFHRPGRKGRRATSVPLTSCNRMPPPLPLSAVLPMITLLSITRLGPVPSLSAGAQSVSATVLPHSTAPADPSGAAPRTAIPPPLVGIEMLLLWLKRIQLCEISPL